MMDRKIGQSTAVIGVIRMLLLAMDCRASNADELRIEDPFAAVDGTPVTIGRLNLVLTQRFPGRSPKDLDPKIRAAAATQLVRQQLAMRSLLKQGGQNLRRGMEAAVNGFQREVKQRGVPLDTLARARQADARAILDDVRWKHAWGQYLKSQLTEVNLRTFYDRSPKRFGGTSFEQLKDAALLKKEASAAMFEALVRRSKDAKVDFFDEKLRPPEGFPLIPEKKVPTK